MVIIKMFQSLLCDTSVCVGVNIGHRLRPERHPTHRVHTYFPERLIATWHCE